MVKITSEEELEAWLKTRPSEDAKIIAHRAALRVFPNWGRAIDGYWGWEMNLTALPVLRTILASWVENKLPDPEPKSATLRAVTSANIAAATASSAIYRSVTTMSAGSARSAASAAHASATIGHTATSSAAASASSAAESHLARSNADFISADYVESVKKEMWWQISMDAEAFLSIQLLETAPLWHNSEPDWFTTANAETKGIWDQDPEPWTFWRRWWQGHIDGTKPFPDDLLHDIALIPDEVWQQGPKPVHAEIEKIEERHALKAEVAALRAELQQFQSIANASASAAHRSHNQPPELIDDQVAVARQITAIVNALVEAEAELALPQPSPSKLQHFAKVLIAGVKAIAFYCGKLTDKALTKAAKELGSTGIKWAFRVGGATLLAQNQPIQDLAKAIFSFAAKLNGH